ncbi:MAG: carbohydrate ABC transporter permease [Lachnospirales bacterium]
MKKNKGTLCAYVFLIFCSTLTIFPMLFMLSLSLRTRESIIQKGVFFLPEALHWENYITAWNQGHFSTYFKNSIIISFISVIGVIIFSTCISYALVFFKFKGRKIISNLLLIGLIIPFEVVIIPLYFNMKFVGLLGTRSPVYLTHIALNIAFSVFIMKGFIMDIPKSIIESARTDGATEMIVLRKIVVPIIIPALVSIVILIFMWTWNDFMLSNLMLTNDKIKTLPLGLSSFQGKFTRDVPLTSAASTIMMVPVLIIYIVFQKYMIKGLTLGAVKE